VHYHYTTLPTSDCNPGIDFSIPVIGKEICNPSIPFSGLGLQIGRLYSVVVALLDLFHAYDVVGPCR